MSHMMIVGIALNQKWHKRLELTYKMAKSLDREK